MLNTEEIWKGFHWSFFVNVQALIICLRRFESSLALEDITILIYAQNVSSLCSIRQF